MGYGLNTISTYLKLFAQNINQNILRRKSWKSDKLQIIKIGVYLAGSQQVNGSFISSAVPTRIMHCLSCQRSSHLYVYFWVLWNIAFLRQQWPKWVIEQRTVVILKRYSYDKSWVRPIHFWWSSCYHSSVQTIITFSKTLKTTRKK